jgi:alpha-beta hydrolase superfamily lysophospholipase
MHAREVTSHGIGGLELFARAWLPESAPRSVLVVAHGLGEHSGRYAQFAGDACARGHAVYALDHRGHGRSPGPRANIDRFDHVVSDFCTFAGRAARQHLDTPVFVLGHSMGGAIALAAAHRLQKTLRGLVLSAPALGLAEAPPATRQILARLLSSVAPNTGVMRVAPADVSRDPRVVRDYESDPLVHHAAVPARTVVELLDAMERFPAMIPRVRLPTLILHGMADRLVPLAGTRNLYQTFDVKLRTVRLYEGCYHEVLNEPERDRIVADLLDWIDRV